MVGTDLGDFITLEAKSWDELLANPSIISKTVKDLEDQQRDDRSMYKGRIGVVLPINEKSDENENKFTSLMREALDQRVKQYEGASKWAIYKESFKNGIIDITRSTPLIPFAIFYIALPYGRLSPGMDVNLFSYVGIPVCILLSEGFHFWLYKSLRNSKRKVLASARDNISVLYQKNVL